MLSIGICYACWSNVIAYWTLYYIVCFLFCAWRHRCRCGSFNFTFFWLFLFWRCSWILCRSFLRCRFWTSTSFIWNFLLDYNRSALCLCLCSSPISNKDMNLNMLIFILFWPVSIFNNFLYHNLRLWFCRILLIFMFLLLLFKCPKSNEVKYRPCYITNKFALSLDVWVIIRNFILFSHIGFYHIPCFLNAFSFCIQLLHILRYRIELYGCGKRHQ